MNYPYDLYIKFLITRKADVNASLASCGLPPLDAQDLIEKSIFPKSATPVSVATYLDSRTAKLTDTNGFLEWADTQDIREMWETQPEFNKATTGRPRNIVRAYNLFADREQRNAFSILMIREFDPEDIAEIFGEKFNVSLNESVINIASKYFFNFGRLTKSDWYELRKTLPQNETEAIDVARGAFSKEFAEYKAGRVPALTFEEILNDIMVTSYYKFKVSVDQPLMDNVAMKWANMAMSAGEKRSRWTGGDKASLSEEVQLRFEFDKPEFKTLAELSEEDK